MTFQEFNKKVDETFISYQASKSGISFSAPNQWRYGQTVMNVLYDIWPKKYNEIKGSDYDCFYDNSKIELTLTKLEKEWKEINQWPIEGIDYY